MEKHPQVGWHGDCTLVDGVERRCLPNPHSILIQNFPWEGRWKAFPTGTDPITSTHSSAPFTAFCGTAAPQWRLEAAGASLAFAACACWAIYKIRWEQGPRISKTPNSPDISHLSEGYPSFLSQYAFVPLRHLDMRCRPQVWLHALSTWHRAHGFHAFWRFN
jgi:hypothetical protein